MPRRKKSKVNPHFRADPLGRIEKHNTRSATASSASASELASESAVGNKEDENDGHNSDVSNDSFLSPSFNETTSVCTPPPSRKRSSSRMLSSTPPSAAVASPVASDDNEDTDDEVSNRLPVNIRRAGKTTHRLRSSFTKEDLIIGAKSAEKLLGLKTIQRPYHRLLEYPRLFYVDKSNGQRYEVSLELQVNLIVAYMLHLLARRGLGAKGVFKGAFEHLTSRGYLSRVNVSSQLNLC